MWQSQAPSGALSFGGSVPAEFGTCWPWLRRPVADAVAAIATIEALLMKVRRAIISISLFRKGWSTRCPSVKTAALGPGGFRISFPRQEEIMKIRVKPFWAFLRASL